MLTANPIKDAGIAALRAWRHLAELEVLYLSNCKLTYAGVSMLVDTPLPRLIKLDASDNRLDDQIGKAIAAKAKHLPALRVLELKSAGIGMPAISALDKADLPQLARVDVRRNRISRDEVAAMPRFRAGAASRELADLQLRHLKSACDSDASAR